MAQLRRRIRGTLCPGLMVTMLIPMGQGPAGVKANSLDPAWPDVAASISKKWVVRTGL